MVSIGTINGENSDIKYDLLAYSNLPDCQFFVCPSIVLSMQLILSRQYQHPPLLLHQIPHFDK